MDQTDLSGYVRTERAERKVKYDPGHLVLVVPLLVALTLMFFFAATGANTYALYAGLAFAALVAVAFVYSRFRSYTCSSCRAPMEAEWHDMRPGDRAHKGRFGPGEIPSGFSEDVTYGVTYDPFAYVRCYRRVYVCRPCKRYFWGNVFKDEVVAGPVEGLIEYEEKRSGKKVSTDMQRLARRFLRRGD